MTDENKDYICQQCGADPNGSEVHALTHHTFPQYPEREALEIVELTETICQKNECIDNRNRTLREQEKLIDELKGKLTGLEKDRDFYKREFERAAKMIDKDRVTLKTKDDEIERLEGHISRLLGPCENCPSPELIEAEQGGE